MVPHWAHQAIARLSTHSGVSSQKILETALRDGLQLVAQPLGAWVKYQQTAEDQWNEHADNPKKTGETRRTDRAKPAPGPDPFEEPVEGERDSAGLDLPDDERGYQAAISESDQVLNGE